MPIRTLWFFLLLLPATLPAASPSEQQVSRELKNRLDSAQTVDLQAGDESFVALYRKNSLPMLQGAVILLHDQKRNADWPKVISPLRKKLSERGWDTLSIQLPVSSGLFVPTQENQNQDANPRIAAAMQYLLGLAHEKIVLLGHGTGGAIASGFAATQPQKELIGVVSVNFATARNEDSDSIEKIKIPMLDIYGKRNTRQNPNGVEQRKQQALTAANGGFSQHEVVAADHEFTGLQDYLASRVHGWMSRAAKNP